MEKAKIVPSDEDKIISEFLKSIGPWSEHIVIGGGFALFIYKLYLADHTLDHFPVGTRDIDSLISRRVPKVCKKDLRKHLQDAGFKHIFKDRDMPPTEGYVKQVNGIEVEIEFLTDSAVRNYKNKNIRVAGVVAQPLSYLHLSLQTSMKFRTSTCESGRVVSPDAWIFHKGLTFPRRGSVSKRLKDLYGIWYVTSQLGNFSEQVVEEFNILTKEHAKWLQTFRKNLYNWLKGASPDEWLKLEAQDPSGKLKKLNFERSIQKLLV